MVWKTYFRNHILLFILVALLIIISVASYCRFMVKDDYVVSYEGVCDPTIDKCFIGCNDDACTEEYYYSKTQKYASDLYMECGKDITDCEDASMCLSTDRNCLIVYCNPEVDGDVCKTSISGIDDTQNIDKVIPVEENLLLNDNTTNN